MRRALLLGVVLAVFLAAPANGAVQLTASTEVEHWRSKRSFPEDKTLQIRVRIAERRVPQTALNGCRGTYAGGPLIVWVNLCNQGRTVLRLTYVAKRDVRFSVRYWLERQ